MNPLLLAATICTLIALLSVRASFRQLRRGRLLRATGSAGIGAASAALATASVLFLFSYMGYQRLTAEQAVAVIEFSRSAPEEYTARVMIDGQLDRLLPLRGNEWQLDARILTWKPPATLLGLEPVYELERLSGRYSSIDRERSEPRTVHDLAEERALDLWGFARKYPGFAPGIDAFYGTATYLPMADAARYQVSISRDALLARPVNDAAREAVGDWDK